MNKYIQTSQVTQVKTYRSPQSVVPKHLYFDGSTGTYPAKNSGEWIIYHGHINPAELSLTNYNVNDVWIFEEPKPAKIVQWLPNSQSFASVSSGQPTNTRYKIMSLGGVATEYRDVSVLMSSLEGIQFFGETGADGSNLITLNGSALLTSWSLVGGYYECLASARLNQTISSTETSAYYVSAKSATAVSQVETLYSDDIPLIPQTAKVNVLTNNDFYWDGTKVYVLFNPAAKKMEFTKYDAAFYSSLWAGGNTTSSDSVSCAVISNLNITKYGGNNLISAIGSRNMKYTTGKPYANGTQQWGWLIQNCNAYLNRGNGIHLFSKSTIRNCKSYNNGAKGICGNSDITDTYLPNVYGYVRGNTVYQNNFAGYTNTGGNATSGNIKITNFSKLKVEGNNIYRGGKSFYGDYLCDGLWFDVYCNNIQVRNNRLIGNVGNGFTYELCNDLVFEYNFIHSNLDRWQVAHSTSYNCIYQFNTIYGNLIGEQNDPSNGTLNQRTFGLIYSDTRGISNNINTQFRNNQVYFGLEGTNEGCYGIVNELLYYQGTFTPASPTDAQKYSYTVAQNIVYTNNSYYKRTSNTNGKNFVAWAPSTISRKTLAEMQTLGYEIGSTMTTLNF
jgi:hypothetical protein